MSIDNQVRFGVWHATFGWCYDPSGGSSQGPWTRWKAEEVMAVLKKANPADPYSVLLHPGPAPEKPPVLPEEVYATYRRVATAKTSGVTVRVVPPTETPIRELPKRLFAVDAQIVGLVEKQLEGCEDPARRKAILQTAWRIDEFGAKTRAQATVAAMFPTADLDEEED